MGASHREYVTGMMTFISSSRFSSWSTNGNAAYVTGRLGRNTGLADGLRDSVASAWVQRLKLF